MTRRTIKEVLTKRSPKHSTAANNSPYRRKVAVLSPLVRPTRAKATEVSIEKEALATIIVVARVKSPE